MRSLSRQYSRDFATYRAACTENDNGFGFHQHLLFSIKEAEGVQSMGANGVGASGGNRNWLQLISWGNGASATVLFAEQERRVTQRV